MKKKLLQYGICGIVGALLALWVMDAEGMFVITGNPAESVSILCDAFFVSGIFLAGIGALVWISTTGFFDSLGYAVHVAAHLFVPFMKTKRKTYYDYKMERDEKRSPAIRFILIVGLFYIALAGIFLIIWMTY